MCEDGAPVKPMPFTRIEKVRGGKSHNPSLFLISDCAVVTGQPAAVWQTAGEKCKKNGG